MTWLHLEGSKAKGLPYMTKISLFFLTHQNTLPLSFSNIYLAHNIKTSGAETKLTWYFLLVYKYHRQCTLHFSLSCLWAQAIWTRLCQKLPDGIFFFKLVLCTILIKVSAE